MVSNLLAQVCLKVRRHRGCQRALCDALGFPPRGGFGYIAARGPVAPVVACSIGARNPTSQPFAQLHNSAESHEILISMACEA